ncbi:MAG TPA: zinc ribbon domain-containing protein, partial [bacterium]|nr:zinc ribbon domain-containing protein [bacterium]
MPTYDYECTKCGARFEVFHAMGDQKARQCTKCGKSARRLISAGAGIIVKGASGGLSCSAER